MQRNSEFPLFLQTAIAIFGFLFVISMVSAFNAPQPTLQGAIAPIGKISQK